MDRPKRSLKLPAAFLAALLPLLAAQAEPGQPRGVEIYPESIEGHHITFANGVSLPT